MKAALAHLEEFAVKPCAFRCTRAGKVHPPADDVFIARVVHRLNRRATATELWELRALLGEYAAEAELIYAAHNGFVLYKDCLSDAAGIEALPVRRWAEAAKDLNESLSSFVAGHDPDHILGGVPFAQVPHSGNYFVIPIEGSSAGKVFYADHDGWYESAFAVGFDDFVHRVTTNPAAPMSNELGCYTRYSDGATNAQWIPRAMVLNPSVTT